MNAQQTTVYATPGVPGQVFPIQQGMTFPAQVTVLAAPSSPPEMSDSHRCRFVALGATQLALGCLCVLFNIVAIILAASLTMILAPGIWCGILVSAVR